LAIWTKIRLEGLSGSVKDVIVTEIASSTSAFAVTKGGNLWVSGGNNYGQLGTDSTTNVSIWEKISIAGFSGHVVSVVSNGGGQTYNAYAITDDGNLWVTGYNSNYVLGTGTESQIEEWTKIEVEGLSGHVRKVSAFNSPGFGPRQAYAVTDDLNLFVTGIIESGSGNPFGFSVTSPVTKWTKVIDMNIAGHVSDIFSVMHYGGHTSAFVITDRSDLYVTGHNSWGQLGLGHSNPVFDWTKVEAEGVAGNVGFVTGGANGGTFLITHLGDLFVAGRNSGGQLGVGDTAERKSWTKIETEGLRGKAVSAKIMPGCYSQSISTIVVTSSNDLFVAGQNANGELGLGHTKQQLHWVKVSTPGLSGMAKI
jgi:alpha-tubulin suppressor-like RCC1 family protein